MIPNLEEYLYHKITRRSFLKGAAALGTAIVLGGCAQKPSRVETITTTTTPPESEATSKSPYREGWPKFERPEQDIGLNTYPAYRFIDGYHDAEDAFGKHIPEAEIEKRGDAVWYTYRDRETLHRIDKIKYRYPVMNVTELLNERPEKLTPPKTEKEWSMYLLNFLPKDEEEAEMVKMVPNTLVFRKFENYEDLKKYDYEKARSEGIPFYLLYLYHKAYPQGKEYILEGARGNMRFWVVKDDTIPYCVTILAHEMSENEKKIIAENIRPSELQFFGTIFPAIKVEVDSINEKVEKNLIEFGSSLRNDFKKSDLEKISNIYLHVRERRNVTREKPTGRITTAILSMYKMKFHNGVLLSPSQQQVLRNLYESALKRM